MEPIKFVLDVHLGKLAKALRMLGIDTIWENNYTKEQLLNLAKETSGILLSRDELLLKQHANWGLLIQSTNWEEQLREVLNKYPLNFQVHPLSRCLKCNGLLQAIPKEKIADRLLPNTAKYFEDFFQCSHCGRIYWKGSHYDRMLQRVETILSGNLQ